MDSRTDPLSEGGAHSVCMAVKDPVGVMEGVSRSDSVDLYSMMQS